MLSGTSRNKMHVGKVEDHPPFEVATAVHVCLHYSCAAGGRRVYSRVLVLHTLVAEPFARADYCAKETRLYLSMVFLTYCASECCSKLQPTQDTALCISVATLLWGDVNLSNIHGTNKWIDADGLTLPRQALQHRSPGVLKAPSHDRAPSMRPSTCIVHHALLSVVSSILFLIAESKHKHTPIHYSRRTL